MVSSARHHRYTYSEYLALEEHANVRHEFFDGEIYAMAGGTPEHAAICTNVSTALNVQLRGRGGRVHSSDLLIRVLEPAARPTPTSPSCARTPNSTRRTGTRSRTLRSSSRC